MLQRFSLYAIHLSPLRQSRTLSTRQTSDPKLSQMPQQKCSNMPQTAAPKHHQKRVSNTQRVKTRVTSQSQIPQKAYQYHTLHLTSPPNGTNPTPQPSPISPQITHQRFLQRALRNTSTAEVAETASHAWGTLTTSGRLRSWRSWRLRLCGGGRL